MRRRTDSLSLAITTADANIGARQQRVPPGDTDHWRSSFGRRIHIFTNVSNLMAIVEEDNGTLRAFNGTGKEIHNTNGAATTLQNLGSSGWRLTRPDSSVELFDASGAFVSATTRSGVATVVSRDAGGRIATVTNSFGRTLSLSYVGGQLTSLTIPGGLQITYGYDAQGRLETATYADGAVKRYVYADPYNNWLLTGLIDKNGHTFATYTYDLYGRVVAEERAGAEKYTFSYPSLSSEMTTQLVDPLGRARNYTLKMVNGVFKTRTMSAYCPSCTNIGSATFDANGNYASKYDLGGRGATYVYDLNRNLQTSRTEGSGTRRERLPRRGIRPIVFPLPRACMRAPPPLAHRSARPASPTTARQPADAHSLGSGGEHLPDLDLYI